MKVYLVEPIHPKAYSYLQNYCEIVDDLSDCDGLITRNIKINASIMDQAKKLKVIGAHGTGINDIDVVEAHHRNIIVFNAPNQNSLSVAEMNVALMMNISKNMKEAMNHYPSNELAPISLMGNEISNKVVGFIGLGNIAIKTANMLHFGFQDTILAYSRTPKNIDYIKECSIKEVVSQSDYIILGVALNDSTKGMINEELFALMKPTSYLINTTRGAVVNEEDLLQAFKNHQIAGYASDVFVNEPAVNEQLYSYNVIMSPHIGANTDEALERVGMLCVKQMVDALQGKEIPFEIKQ